MFGAVQRDPRSLPGRGKEGGGRCISFDVCDIVVGIEMCDAEGGGVYRVSMKVVCGWTGGKPEFGRWRCDGEFGGSGRVEGNGNTELECVCVGFTWWIVE